MHRRIIFCLIPLFLILLVFSCTRKSVIPPTEPPVINAIEASPYIVSKEGTVYLNLAVTDPDEDKMYFEWSCPEGQFFADVSLNTPSNITNPCWWKAPATEGNYTISVTCTDSIGDDPEFVDTSLTVSVSIYSLDSIIGESEFSSPFSMYIDDDGNLFVSDPGLSAVHFNNGTNWYSWNFSGLCTTITIDTINDTIFDTTEIINKVLFESPTAITVDEEQNLLYVADVMLDSTRISVYDINNITSDTLYGFLFRLNDRTDLNFRISAPYSFVVDPSSKWFYVSTRISIIAYDTTWVPDGWIKNWSTSTATGGINFEGKGMKLFNGDLFLACFGVKDDTVRSCIRRFTDITGTSPTEVMAIYSDDDSTIQYLGGIAIGQNGNINGHIFVTQGGGSDEFYHRIVEYDENGNFIRTFGSIGEKEDQFNYPTDIFIDSSGNIYVVDMGNHCIKVFSE
ncbi:MAG: NHL repeat-containing protein [Bacteroidetes bacterium]|nr:NHL repeat-containing protein [Bacteroidota bacterium]